MSNIVGIYSQGSGNFGFIDVHGRRKGYFVHEKNKKNAFSGDKVEGKIVTFRGREEAVIVRIIERKNTVIVGKFHSYLSSPGEKNTFGFVIPQNSPFSNNIFVTIHKKQSVKKYDLVLVKITGWKGKNLSGEIIKIYQKNLEHSPVVESILLSEGMSLFFPQKVKEQCAHIYTKKYSTCFSKRKNLQHLFTFTIDGEDAKDLDDAICVRMKKNSEYILYVHIADVSHYVKKNSFVDEEARNRCTSVYLPDRVIPMLPSELSNDLCSLHPRTTKYTLTSEMLFDKNGVLKSTCVYESIIESDYRLTYEEVDKILQGEKPKLHFGGEISDTLIENIHISESLSKILTKKRKQNGNLNFSFPEIKILFDKKGRPSGIKKYETGPANMLIENFMVSANEAVARKFHMIPFLYRVHEKPSCEDIMNLKAILANFDISYVPPLETSKDFSALLHFLKKFSPQKKRVVEKFVLQSLSKALYSPKNIGHFGLGLKYYSHFTSPIRRYGDLLIHRIIKEKILNHSSQKEPLYSNSVLDNIGAEISHKQREAEKIEYRVRDYYITQLYKKKIGEEFEAIIVSIFGEKGFFVELENSVQGFVQFSQSIFLQRGKIKIVGEKKCFGLGDTITVRLDSVCEKRFYLYFSPSFLSCVNS